MPTVPPVRPGPFPQPEAGLRFILPVLHRDADGLAVSTAIEFALSSWL